jgi:outer membrane protein assembly factor BamB
MKSIRTLGTTLALASITVVCITVAPLTASAAAEPTTARATTANNNWPHWRGPYFNGSSDATGLPSTWSRRDVRWTTPLPGPSAATPIVWQDRVFVSSADTDARAVVALGLDRMTGRILWRHTAAEVLQRDEKSNYASPSPVADAARVVFFYGNGALAAFSHEGRATWSRSLAQDYGEFAFLWTFASSPLLVGDTLFIQVLQRDVPVNGRGRPGAPIDSYLLALDAATGKTRWLQTRASDAVAESRESFASPIPFETASRSEILVAGGDCLSGHDPATGRELWRWGTWNPGKIGHWRLVPSPVAGGGVILACAPKGDPIYAIRAGGAGALDDASVVWRTDKSRGITADVPTPLFYKGDFFVLSDVRKNLSRVDPLTGDAKWTLELPGRRKFEASPTGADSKIYLMNFAGDVVVVDAVQGTILATIPMGEDSDDLTRSTIAVAGRHLFIRTNRRLDCVGSP